MAAPTVPRPATWYLAVNEPDWVAAVSTFKHGTQELSSSAITPHSFPVGLWHKTPEKAIEAGGLWCFFSFEMMVLTSN